MVFHLTDAKRFLASAEKVVQAGNEIKMSARDDGCYVRNLMTGKRIPFVRKNGVFVMNVNSDCTQKDSRDHSARLRCI